MGNTVTRIPPGAVPVLHQWLGRCGCIYNGFGCLLNSQCYIMFENEGVKLFHKIHLHPTTDIMLVRTLTPHVSIAIHSLEGLDNKCIEVEIFLTTTFPDSSSLLNQRMELILSMGTESIKNLCLVRVNRILW